MTFREQLMLTLALDVYKRSGSPEGFAKLLIETVDAVMFKLETE